MNVNDLFLIFESSDVPHLPTSERDSEGGGSTIKPIMVLREDDRVPAVKRKASRPPEAPGKRSRDGGEPAAVSAETVRERKRESCTERLSTTETPGSCDVQPSSSNPSTPRQDNGNTYTSASESREGGGSTTKPIMVLREDDRVPATKRKASRPPEAPGKRSRDGGEPAAVSAETVRERKRESCTERLSTTETPGSCDVQPSSSNPSTPRQDNGNTYTSASESRACFKEKYLQLEILGEGGFGSVYSGRRRADNFPVAIKHIRKGNVKTRPVFHLGKVRQVPLEVLLMMQAAGRPASVGKSAVVSLLDWYDLEQEIILVMERPVPSEDLFTYILNNGGPLQEDTALSIMKQLVDAVLHMHSNGVFHRDIKSENILIQTGSDGLRVRIIDFGCSCIMTDQVYRRFAGTAEFTPPEFYLCGGYEAGPTTVWQLGVVLYEMLQGLQPFTTTEFIHNKITFSSELSRGCLDLLNLCLAVDPSERATLEQLQRHPCLTPHCSP